MSDDTKKNPNGQTDYNYHILDDQTDDSADVDETNIDNISNDILDRNDEPANEDEVSLSELAEEEGSDDDEENNDVDNLRPGGIDEGTD